MAEIRLLAAPVDTPSTSEVNAEYLSLAPASRLALANRASTRSDTIYPGDDFVWLASAGTDGSFTFYAAPQNKSGNSGASSSWDSFSPAQMPGSDWYTRNAIAQYTLHSMPAATFGQLISLYA